MADPPYCWNPKHIREPQYHPRVNITGQDRANATAPTTAVPASGRHKFNKMDRLISPH